MLWRTISFRYTRNVCRQTREGSNGVNENKTLLKNTGLIAIGNLGAKVLTFLLLPLYTSILSTEEYGTFDFIVALSSFLIPLVSLSMNEAMFRFIIEGGNDRESVQKNISHALALELLALQLC